MPGRVESKVAFITGAGPDQGFSRPFPAPITTARPQPLPCCAGLCGLGVPPPHAARSRMASREAGREIVRRKGIRPSPRYNHLESGMRKRSRHLQSRAR
jgi:hypothetical protein